MGHTGDSTLLRRVNQSAVLETLREEGPLARSDIARRLQLSPPTITRIVAGLLESGAVPGVRVLAPVEVSEGQVSTVEIVTEPFKTPTPEATP